MISRRAFAMIVPMTAASTLRLRAAGADGKWEAEIDSPRGPMVLTFDLKSDGGSLTGTIGNDLMGEVEIHEGKVSGDEVSFVQKQARGDFEIRMMYTGKVTGDEMEVTRSVERPPGGRGGGRPGGGPPPQGGARGGRGPGGGRGGARGQGPGGARRGGGLGRSVTFVAKRVQ